MWGCSRVSGDAVTTETVATVGVSLLAKRPVHPLHHQGLYHRLREQARSHRACIVSQIASGSVQNTFQDLIHDPAAYRDQDDIRAQTTPFVTVVTWQVLQRAVIQTTAIAAWQRMAPYNVNIGR